MTDLYDLFNIRRDKFSMDDLKKSYRTLALANHPDKLGTGVEDHSNPISRINEGYEILSKYRVCYDFFPIENVSILQDYIEQAQLLFPGMETHDSIEILSILVSKEDNMIGNVDKKNDEKIFIKCVFGCFWIWLLCNLLKLVEYMLYSPVPSLVTI